MANLTKRELKKLAILQKILLRQTLAEFGVTGMLYAKNDSSPLHPFTQEIILYAYEQGYDKNQISNYCKVPPSRVSEWKNAEVKADIATLTPLVNALSPIAPGDNFWHIQIIKGEPCFHFPEHWEEQMLANVQELSIDEFRQGLKFAIETKIENKINSIERDNQGQLDKITHDIETIETSLQAYLHEQKLNSEQNQRYQKEKQALITANPNYSQLSTEDIQAIMERKITPIVLSTKAKEAYQLIQQHYQFDHDNHAAFIADLKNIKKSLEKEQQEIQEKRTQLEQEYNPLNNYAKQTAPIIATADLTGKVKSTEIDRLIYLLYPENQHYDFKFHQHTSALSSVGFFSRQKISGAEALKHYLTSQNFHYEGEESIQLCGKHITSFPKTNDQPYCSQKIEENGENPYYSSYHRRSNNEECLDLFQLQSNRLAIIYSIFNRNKNNRLCQLHLFDNIDELVIFLAQYLSQNKINEWRNLLIELGYTSAGARIVY